METEEKFNVLLREIRTLRIEVGTLSAKLSKMIQDKPSIITGETLDTKITALLHDLKIPANLKGYAMIREALKLIVDDFSVVTSITKVLYPTIAKQFGTTPGRAERAIRHAIEVSYQKNRTHPYYANHQRIKPTNSQFLADMADKFRLEESQLQAADAR